MLIDLLIPFKEEWEPEPLYLELEYTEYIPDEEEDEEERGSVIIIDI